MAFNIQDMPFPNCGNFVFKVFFNLIFALFFIITGRFSISLGCNAALN